MFVKLWQWADREQIEAATGFADPRTKQWLIKRMIGPKPVRYVAIFPVAKEHVGIETVTDPDSDGVVWMISGPNGDEEWIDPLPGRVLKEGAYRYEARVTFFNDDGTCPDHTGKSGRFVTRGIAIKYPGRSDPSMNEKVLMAKVVYTIRRHADEVRRIIGVQEQDTAEQQGGFRRSYGELAGEKLAGLAVRCGACVHPASDDARGT